MSLNIENEILKQIIIMLENNYKPKFLYIGKQELEQLLTFIKSKYTLKDSMLKNLHFHGLKVIKVKEENHLNVV